MYVSNINRKTILSIYFTSLYQVKFIFQYLSQAKLHNEQNITFLFCFSRAESQFGNESNCKDTCQLMQTSSYNRDICSVMKDCNASKGIHNVTDEEPSSQQFAAVNTNRIAYHTSSSVPNALHNLNSLKSSIGYYCK